MSFRERFSKMDCNTRGHWIAFWVCLLISIFLMIGSALTPPHFVIDSTIFKGVAWLFGFAALAQVPSIVDSGKTAILRHGKTSLTVGHMNDNLEDYPEEPETEES